MTTQTSPVTPDAEPIMDVPIFAESEFPTVLGACGCVDYHYADCASGGAYIYVGDEGDWYDPDMLPYGHDDF